MGLIDFNETAGATFGNDAAADVRARVRTSRELLGLIQNTGFDVDELKVGYDDGVVTVNGTVPNQEVREKMVLILGNVQGVAKVDRPMLGDPDEIHPGQLLRIPATDRAGAPPFGRPPPGRPGHWGRALPAVARTPSGRPGKPVVIDLRLPAGLRSSVGIQPQHEGTTWEKRQSNSKEP